MSLRRIGCGLLAMILSLLLALPVTSYASNFPDVNGHWAEFYISKVYNEHIISGYPNGRFQPDKAVTRAEFIVMLNKTYDLDRLDSDEAVNYSDVTASSWYYNDISTALAAGYISSYKDNTFKPNTPITRQEAAVMLSNLIPEGKKSGSLKSFSDSKQIDKSATEAMTKIIGKGYLSGYSDKKLHPTDPVTRAQAAKILSEIMDNEDIITRKTVVDEDKTELTAKTYVGDVLIDEDLEEGSATIENCIILGDLIVEGGGNGTITLNNTRVMNCIVNKEDSAVRIVAKGDTIVQKLEASESCYLQTSSKDGYGFPDITVNKMAELTLKGTFPFVNIIGNRASLSLESGKITKLTVTGAGKYSDITLTGKAEIAEATVNAECYFHGTGTIIYMTVNADDVTYETKPDKMTVGLEIDRPETEGDEDVTVTFKPKNKADDVDVDTKITVTFNTSMKLANGSQITDSNINSFLKLYKGSKSGDAVAFKATINSAKKVITITPDADLIEGTKYYVVLTDEALKNAGGNENDGESIYFTTEGDAPTTTTTPAVTTPISDATLSSLTLATSGGINLITNFSETTKTYNVTVPFGTTLVDVTASTNTTTNTNAVITINSTAATSLTGITVTAGTTTAINVRITADNKTTSNYVINVTVAST